MRNILKLIILFLLSSALVIWYINNQDFHSAQKITQYLKNLNEVNLGRALEQLRCDLVRGSIRSDQLLHNIYEWVSDFGLDDILISFNNRKI